MPADPTYTIGELAELADVTVRTIRYYVAEGLLPPPESGGRAACYTGEHLDRLALIKLLKDEYLPLQEIRALLEGLDHPAVVELLTQKQAGASPPPAPDSAKEYLQRLLQLPASPPEAAQFLRHQLAAQRRPDKAAEEAAGYALKMKSDDRSARGALAPPPAAAGRAIPGSAPATPVPGRAKAEAAVNRWRRVEVIPGLELHIREDLENQLGPKLEQLVQTIQNIVK